MVRVDRTIPHSRGVGHPSQRTSEPSDFDGTCVRKKCYSLRLYVAPGTRAAATLAAISLLADWTIPSG